METTTIGAGYSLWGRLDFGFTFGFLNTTSFSDAKSASLSLAWYFAKQENAKRGVSAAIALSYQHLTYGRHTLEKAYPFQPTTVTEAENSTILGLVLFRDVSFDEVYLVQPILSAQLVSAKRNTFVAGSIGISIGGKNQLARAFAITPTIGFQEGVVFYGVAVSVVISTSRKE